MTDVIEAMVIAFMESEDRQKQAGGFDYRVSLRAALAAALERGWVLVPKEPTEEMLEASWGVSCRPTIEVALESCPRKQHWLKTAARYRSMIQSSPKVGR